MSAIKGHRFHPLNPSQGTQIPRSLVASSSQSSKTSFLDSSPLLDYLGFRFHTKHLVMICVACECAIWPENAITHVKKQHSIPVSKVQQEEWDQTTIRWNVAPDHLAPPPMHNCQPVELLKLHSNAYCCNSCPYAALTIGTFSKHWSMTHQSLHILPSERYHDGCVQTFYSHAPCTYFQVDIPIPSSTTLFNVYMKKELPGYAPFDVILPSAPREIPPLLYNTRWHEHIADYITDREKCRTLFMLAHPTSYTKNPLWKLVWNYLGTVASIAKNTSMRVRCLLTEYPRYII